MKHNSVAEWCGMCISVLVVVRHAAICGCLMYTGVAGGKDREEPPVNLVNKFLAKLREYTWMHLLEHSVIGLIVHAEVYVVYT